MAPMCRICGPKTSAEELIMTMNTEVKSVTLRYLFEMFTHVKFDDSLVLPQRVCESCRLTLFSFIEFSRRVEETQDALKKLPVIKNEDAGRGCVIRSGVNKSCDEKLDSPIVFEESFSSTLCNDSGVRDDSVGIRKAIADYDLKKCSVVLERMPLLYVPTDSENEGSDSDEEKTGKKRLFNSSSDTKSPNKRMRFAQTSPVAAIAEVKPVRPFSLSSFKAEATEKPVTIVTTQDMLLYQGIFMKELSENITLSKCNLNVPDCAKEPGSDGRVKDEYAQIFTLWNAIEVKCPDKTCNKKLEPYQMKLHLEDHHKDREGVFKCSMRGCSDGHGFVKFCQHVIDKHYQYLSYSCVLCSSMFFNYASLYRHYQGAHCGFSSFHICLRDGCFFDSLEKLENHVTIHKRVNPRISFNNNDLSESQENVKVPGANHVPFCDTCSMTFDTPFDLKWHMLSHTNPEKFTV